MTLKIVFFGTPKFASEILDFLVDQKVNIVGVVTQPDRPKGRSRVMTPSAVKEIVAQKIPHIPLFQPEKASQELFLEELRSLHADLFVVVAYGQILSSKLLAIPPLGCINIHASLLPKYRGAAPIQRSLMNGDKQTGIAIQKMVRELDAGPLISSVAVNVLENMTFGELEKSLCDASKPLLMTVLKSYEDGTVTFVEQDHSQATYAAKIELEHGYVCFSQDSEVLHNLIRSFSPKPGAWTWLEKNSKRLKIIRSEWVPNQSGEPGNMISKDGIIGCGKGSIRLLEVQPEGKKVMTWMEWFRGNPSFSRFPL